MLKLNASYSKKVPAETEYSSQSYHASVEVELPDGLTSDQLQERIHATFALVRGKRGNGNPWRIAGSDASCDATGPADTDTLLSCSKERDPRIAETDPLSAGPCP